ncbi:MAG: hypothetical protein WBM43_12825 [Flavobacteriaceae bacterium]
MKRRKFALLAGLGISAIAIPTWYYNFYKQEKDWLMHEPELLSYICDSPAIIDIGENYRQQFPDENSELKLIELLSNSTSAGSTTSNEILRQKIKADYNEGNAVMVDGWILSRTEARQCALFSIIQTN